MIRMGIAPTMRVRASKHFERATTTVLTYVVAWAGHWRGENGTDETVICEPSFTERWPLDAMCMRGWTVAASSYTQFWASDLHHRLFHTGIGEGVVDHYADDYGPSLELAMERPEEAVRNSHSLAMFALDTYAFDVGAPNEGCTGEYVPDEEEEDAAAEGTSTSSSVAMTTTSSDAVEATAEAASTTTEEAETSTTSSEEHCHTHDTGEVHCS